MHKKAFKFAPSGRRSLASSRRLWQRYGIGTESDNGRKNSYSE